MLYQECSVLPAHRASACQSGDQQVSFPTQSQSTEYSSVSAYMSRGVITAPTPRSPTSEPTDPFPSSLRRTLSKIVSLELLICALATGGQLLAQTVPSSTEPARGVVTVDGAVNPAAIRDEVAFLHFFRMFSPYPGAVSEQWDLDRRKSYISHFFARNCGLNGRDDRYLDDTQRQKLLDYGVKVAKQIAEDEAKTGDLVIAAMRDLESALGGEIAHKVRLHVVEYMKTKIKQTRTDVPYSAK